jgi:hypothetical protein
MAFLDRFIYIYLELLTTKKRNKTIMIEDERDE